MKNYIRTCLSLDEKTITKLKAMANHQNKKMSEIVKTAINYYDEIFDLMLEAERNIQ